MEQRRGDLAERVAALEERAEQGAADREEMKKMLGEIKSKLDRWEGKFGGVLFALFCLWTFFSGAAKALMDWLALSGKG